MQTISAFAADKEPSNKLWGEIWDEDNKLILAKEAAESVNAFAFDLYNELTKDKTGDLVFSPYAIWHNAAKEYFTSCYVVEVVDVLRRRPLTQPRAEFKHVFYIDTIHNIMALLNLISDMLPDSSSYGESNVISHDIKFIFKGEQRWLDNFRFKETKIFVSEDKQPIFIGDLLLNLMGVDIANISDFSCLRSDWNFSFKKYVGIPPDVDKIFLKNATALGDKFVDEYLNDKKEQLIFHGDKELNVDYMSGSSELLMFNGDKNVSVVRLPFANKNFSLLLVLPKIKLISGSLMEKREELTAKMVKSVLGEQ
jgi:hypothetical protein